MAIFTKNEEDKKVIASKADKKVVQKEVKNKKTHKPSADAGSNLTKAPGSILRVPRITEKALKMTLQHAYVFEVLQSATKRDVATAVYTLYQVTPVKVNMVIKKPRAYVARSRNRKGMKSGMKKAYVFLKEGEKIDIA